MIKVSNEFKQLMGWKTDFKENAEIAFLDGTVLVLKETDFTVSNNSIVDSAETNGIPLGIAICRSIKIELMNDDDRFSEYDFFGARIHLYLTFQLSEAVERIEYGTFTVLTPETYGTTVIITALDDMHKADTEYETKLVFPSTIGAMFRDACTILGISQGTTTFLNDDFIVYEKPTDITFRQLFGFIAMLACGNARIDRTGRLQIITYDFEAIEDIRKNIDGGFFVPWNAPVNLDGGDFTYNDGDVADGGNFTDAVGYHILTSWKNLKVDTDDVVITGISQNYTDKNNEQQTAFYGTKGYVLNIKNPLTVGKELEAVKLIGSLMVGGRFRQFSGDLISNPTCEFMDIAAIVDRKNNVYITFITDINFQFFGFTNLKNSAEPAIRNSAKTYSEATETLVSARKLIRNERTAREKAVEQLAKDLANSSGLFMTQDVQPDKSTIYYMHDKPTLSESIIIWKLTSLAFGISTDGGKTYPYGFTVNGELITRLLYAEGIDADYIDTGAIRITGTSGNTMFLADYGTKQVYMDASYVKIGSKSITDEFVDQAAAITVNAKGISSEVTRALNVEKELSSQITQTAENITLEVTRATEIEKELSSKITQNAREIELKVSNGEISSKLSIESGKIDIKSNRFSWESTYSSLTSDGKLKAKDVDLTGKINASEGSIGGFNITTNSIYSIQNSLGGTGVYIGNSGISCGPNFIAKSNGEITVKCGTIAGMSIDNKSIRYGKLSISDGQSGIYVGTDGIAVGFGGLTSSAFKVTSSGDVTIGTQGGLKIEGSDAIICSAGTSYIRGNSATDYKLRFETSKCYVYANYSILGKHGGYIGFFGNEGSTIKTVEKASTLSSVSVTSVATVVNKLIDALKAYNLIG